MYENLRPTKKPLKFTPSGEEKAFIYQQAAELKVPVVVFDNRHPKLLPSDFCIGSANLNLKVKGEGRNVFEACIQAKETAKKRFSRALGFSISSDDEREFLVELMKHKVTIH